MSDATIHLLLPYILAAQAQKHVTHNEALRILDGLVQLSVLDRDLTAPPGSPADGDRYIVATGATGDWAGWDLNVALWTDGAWLRLPPRTGWRAWVEDEGLLLIYDGAGWIGATPDALQNMALLGVGTTADASSPFSAKLNAALWTAKTVAEGGTGDLTIRWTRRSRALSADSWGGLEVPLGEELEAYEVEILNGTIVKRVLSTTTTSALYTAAQQTADWGALLATGDTLDIRIYQLSALVGRGAPKTVMLTF